MITKGILTFNMFSTITRELHHQALLDILPESVEQSVVYAGLVVMFIHSSVKKGKGKGFPYSIPSVGPGADPGRR